MQPTAMKERFAEKFNEHRLAITGGAVTTMTIGLASAGTLADNVTPILQDVAELMGPLLDLIVAAVPMIIGIAVIGFVLGILAAILSKLRM